ncbi:MAG TPA: 2'-5' RNA ligase family protein [Actinomycetes bacterium]|nr:2'-5' RNA ligase family protein [Actinomycetes bacterium]
MSRYDEGSSLTIGVALTVPEPWGTQLQERRASYGDPLAWTIPTHITLLPPTQVQRARKSSVDDHLTVVGSVTKAFDVLLRGTDTFRPVTQTSFVVVEEGGERCTALAEAVRTGPLRRKLPFPYHPHVTVAAELADDVHDRAERELKGYELLFTVTHLERYELTEHGVWESVASFSLSRGL